MFRPFMNFIAVDADPVARDALCQCLAQAAPGCHYAAAGCAADTLAFAADCPPDAVFLDPKLPDMDGIQLADMLLKQYPGLHIIFVTAYAEYAIPAFALHAAGYVLKPADPARLKQELTFLYRKRVKIQTFGGFEVFVDGKLLTFHRAKAKELLACLVDRHGAGLTTREACSLLWEQDAAGSSPVTSTSKNTHSKCKNCLECVFSFLSALILYFYLYCFSVFDIWL